MPADSTHARRGGRRDPADPARPRRASWTRRCSTTLTARMRGAAAARGRPARAAGRQPARRRRGSRRSPSATGSTLAARRDGGGARLRGAPHAGLHRARSPTARYRARDVLEDDGGGADARLEDRGRSARRGDEVEVDFARHRPAERRATSTARCRSRSRPSTTCCGSLTDPDIPASAGAYRPVRVTRSAGLPRQRAAAGRGRGRQRRDLEPDRRRRDARARRRRSTCPALGQGTMNNLTLGNDAVHLLRDARRRPGRLSGRRRAVRRPRRDEQHAQHSGRGARAASSRCASPSTRCGAARAARARYRGGDGLVRELEALAPMDFSLLTERRRHRAAGRGRRRRRSAPAATSCDAPTGRSRSSRARRRGASSRATRCGSRRPAAAATAAEPPASATLTVIGAGCEAAIRVD